MCKKFPLNMSLVCHECNKDIRHPFYSIALLKIDPRVNKGSLSLLEYALCSTECNKLEQRGKSLEEVEDSAIYVVQEAIGHEEFGGVVQWLAGFTGKGNYVFLEKKGARECFPKSVNGLDAVGVWSWSAPTPRFYPAQYVDFDLPHDPKEWQERIDEVYHVSKKYIQYGMNIKK